MALFLYKDVIKYGFKYVYGIIDDIESGKKISVEVSKGLLKEELFVSTDKNQKLKQLKTKLKTGSDQTILQFLKNNIDVFKTADGLHFYGLRLIKLLILLVEVVLVQLLHDGQNQRFVSHLHIKQKIMEKIYH